MEHKTYTMKDKLYLNGGGTKTIFLVESNTVAAIPNAVDGEWLINIWPRIVYEEIKMSDRLESIGIPTLKLTPCIVKFERLIYVNEIDSVKEIKEIKEIKADKFINTDEKNVDEMKTNQNTNNNSINERKTKTKEYTLESISSTPFTSYIKQGIYIIDTNSNSTTWPTDGSLSFIPNSKYLYDLQSWINALTPLTRDIVNLLSHGIYLPIDSLNLAIVSSDSVLHSQINSKADVINNNFQVRLFCFDFSNKRYEINFKEEIKELKQVDCHIFSRILKHSIDNVIVTIHPKKICLNDDEIKHRDTLIQYFVNEYKLK